jgi:hypothetical protein
VQQERLALRHGATLHLPKEQLERIGSQGVRCDESVHRIDLEFLVDESQQDGRIDRETRHVRTVLRAPEQVEGLRPA